MKFRWLINIALLVVVVLGGIYALKISKKEVIEDNLFEVSNLKLSAFDQINIQFPSKQSTVFKLTNQGWFMTQPHQARADELYVYRILAVLATKSPIKIASTDLEKYGLDKPQLKINFSGPNQNEQVIFGTYNPVNEDQYILFKDSIYLISGGFSETSSYEPLELIDKKPIAVYEDIAAFDFSRLEQWQEARLKVNRGSPEWSVLGNNVKLVQDQMDEWFDLTWANLQATSVEPYKMDARIGYKSFDITLSDKKRINFYRIQESPELTLFRKDEGLLYHFPSDLGFTMLNPHVIIDSPQN